MLQREQRHGCLNLRRQHRKQQKFQHGLTLYKKTSSKWEGCKLRVLDPGGEAIWSPLVQGHFLPDQVGPLFVAKGKFRE